MRVEERAELLTAVWETVFQKGMPINIRKAQAKRSQTGLRKPWAGVARSTSRRARKTWNRVAGNI